MGVVWVMTGSTVVVFRVSQSEVAGGQPEPGGIEEECKGGSYI
jgi:hypothetical protein